LKYLKDSNNWVRFLVRETHKGEKGVPAGVYRFGDTIHLNPVFWDHNESSQVHTLVWELGRLIPPRITGDAATKGTNNAANWADIITRLSTDLDYFKQMQDRDNTFSGWTRVFPCPNSKPTC